MSKVIIDVREPFEFMLGHVSGAINIPAGKISKQHKKLANIQKNDVIVVYCQSGGRSAAAENTLRQLGYSNVTNGINKNNVNVNHV